MKIIKSIYTVLFVFILCSNSFSQSTLEAKFLASQYEIMAGSCVDFTDMSSGNPTYWRWTFEGAQITESEDKNPTNICYFTPGRYDVILEVQNTFYTDTEIVKGCITVRNNNNGPLANFTADYTTVPVGKPVKFTDLSVNGPFVSYEWTFLGGTPEKSTVADPEPVVYSQPGSYNVSLTVTPENNDTTITKEDYIVVSTTDPCVAAPVADFSASVQLIQVGSIVNFKDLSLNNPTEWVWTFDGGFPLNSGLSNPIRGIRYLNEGHYSVSLSIRNACGENYVTKEKYIRVFLEPIEKYCDNISNIEGATAVSNPQLEQFEWGFLGGHNSNKIRTYAEKFDQHSFSEIEYLKVPVTRARYLSNNSHVIFYIWEGDTEYPENIIAQKRVPIYEFRTNYVANVRFDKPVEINGPFFAGYRINYAGESGSSAQENDDFAVGLVNWGKAAVSKNTLYIQESGGTWKSVYNKYNTNASSALQAEGCIVDVESYRIDNNIEIYPNPADDYIYIKPTDLAIGKEAIIQLIDITGKLQYSEKRTLEDEEIKINVQNYPNGLYFVNIIAGKDKVARKVVVSR